MVESNILPKVGSDHWPVQLWIDTIATPKIKPFRFEKFWLTHPDFQELAQNWWTNAEIQKGTKMFCFQQKLKHFKQQVHKWNKEVFGNIFQERKMLEQKLEDLQEKIIQTCHTVTQQQEENDIKRKLEERYKQEEILWRQKSRVQWLKEGEKNSKFFHHSMIHRRFINHITKLEDKQGNTLLTHQEIMHELTDFYKDLLSEPLVDRTSTIERVTQNIPTLITQDQNAALMKPIMQEEVDQAVQDLPKGKARPRWFHYRLLPLLLANAQGRGVAVGGGITQLRKSSPNAKCHFSHPNPQRREGYKSEELPANSVMQCDL
jgi:hypothetical protein